MKRKRSDIDPRTSKRSKKGDDGDDPLDKVFGGGGGKRKSDQNPNKKPMVISKTALLGSCTLDELCGDDYVPVPLPSNERAEAIFAAYDKAQGADTDAVGFEFDRVPLPNTTGIYTSTEKSGTFCFACDHVGEMTPAVADTEIALLIENLMTGLLTTELGRHCVNISLQYEERIRKKSNLYLKPGETPLPPWSPRMIKEHIESHHNDPTFTVLMHMSKLKELARVLFDRCLIKKKAPAPRRSGHPPTERTSSIARGGYQYPGGGVVRFGNTNSNDENDDVDNEDEEEHGTNSYDDEEEGIEDIPLPQEPETDVVVCPTVWKITKEVTDMYIKHARSCPEKMAFFKEDRYLTKNGNVGHPFFNSNVKIYSASQRKNPGATGGVAKPTINNFLS